MVGTKSKGRKSKSKALAVVPDEPEPLNVINAEASDSPYGELQKNDDLNSESVLESGDVLEDEHVATDEMYDEEEGSGFAIDDMIVEGNETFLTDEVTEEEDVSDGGDAVTDDVDNGNEGANEEEMEEEEEEELVSCGSANEDVHAEEEEEPEKDASDGGDSDTGGTNLNVENDTNGANEETEEEEEEDEEPASCGSDNEDVHSEEEEEEEGEEEEEPEENMSDGGDITANVDVENDKASEEAEEYEEPVSRGSDNEGIHNGEEEDDEGRADTEHVLIGNLTETRDNDREANELTTEKLINAPAENGIHETPSTAKEVKIVAENDILPKKKIIRRRLIKKKIPPRKAVTSKDEDQMQHLDGNEGASDEAKPHNLEDIHGNLKSEEKKERIPTVKVVRKRVRIRKERPQVQSEKPKPTNDEPVSRANVSIEQKTANVGAEKSKAALGGWLDDRKNKKVQVKGTQKVNVKEDIDKPGSSKSGKSSKKVESQGMIFICSSDTKKDCYRYKVFGLPAAKKDIVSRIYKGMRLFLFDVDLRVLYGVYKAASPGSYNVEPKAFKSRYPSQVRFTVLKEGFPLPEAKFRKVIKDNYYTNSKFDCHLNSEQVRNLCKLFREPESKRGLQSQLPLTYRPSRVDRKRKRVDDVRRVEPGAISSRDRERMRKRSEVERTRIVRDREEPRRALVVRDRDETRRASDVRSREESRRISAVRRHEEMRHIDVLRSREEVRRTPVDIDERYRHPVVIYDGEAYLPPVESSALYQSLHAEDPARSRIYSYERPQGVDTYRRDLGLTYRDVGTSGSRESRHHAEQIARDPYTTYREPQLYREPAYETDTRRERRSYSPVERRYASEYQRPDDYYSPLTLRRRY